jgi:hypothetical protein
VRSTRARFGHPSHAPSSLPRPWSSRRGQGRRPSRTRAHSRSVQRAPPRRCDRPRAKSSSRCPRRRRRVGAASSACSGARPAPETVRPDLLA